MNDRPKRNIRTNVNYYESPSSFEEATTPVSISNMQSTNPNLMYSEPQSAAGITGATTPVSTSNMQSTNPNLMYSELQSAAGITGATTPVSISNMQSTNPNLMYSEPQSAAGITGATTPVSTSNMQSTNPNLMYSEPQSAAGITGATTPVSTSNMQSTNPNLMYSEPQSAAGITGATTPVSTSNMQSTNPNLMYSEPQSAAGITGATTPVSISNMQSTNPNLMYSEPQSAAGITGATTPVSTSNMQSTNPNLMYSEQQSAAGITGATTPVSTSNMQNTNPNLMYSELQSAAGITGATTPVSISNMQSTNPNLIYIEIQQNTTSHTTPVSTSNMQSTNPNLSTDYNITIDYVIENTMRQRKKILQECLKKFQSDATYTICTAEAGQLINIMKILKQFHDDKILTKDNISEDLLKNWHIRVQEIQTNLDPSDVSMLHSSIQPISGLLKEVVNHNICSVILQNSHNTNNQQVQSYNNQLVNININSNRVENNPTTSATNELTNYEHYGSDQHHYYNSYPPPYYGYPPLYYGYPSPYYDYPLPSNRRVENRDNEEHRDAIFGNKDYVSIPGIPEAFSSYYQDQVALLLKLRLEDAASGALKLVNVLEENYTLRDDNADDIAAKLSSFIIASEKDTILMPLNIGGSHLVGIAVVKDGNKVVIHYMDPELGLPPAFLIMKIGAMLESHSYSMELRMVEIEKQKYSNCGPEVIENLTSFATGKSRASQEEAILKHSMALERHLLKDSGYEYVVEVAIQSSIPSEKLLAQLQHYIRTGEAFDTARAAIDGGNVHITHQPFMLDEATIANTDHMPNPTHIYHEESYNNNLEALYSTTEFFTDIHTVSIVGLDLILS